MIKAFRNLYTTGKAMTKERAAPATGLVVMRNPMADDTRTAATARITTYGLKARVSDVRVQVFSGIAYMVEREPEEH